MHLLEHNPEMPLSSSETVVDWLRKSYAAYPKEPALSIDQRVWTYGDLHEIVRRYSGSMASHGKGSFVAIIGNKSFTSYAAIHAILNAGKAYLPINPKEPVSRALTMLEDADVTQIIVGPEAAALAAAILERSTSKYTVCFLEDHSDLTRIARQIPRNDFLFPQDLNDRPTEFSATPSPNDPAYLIYTSGSTGIPKGVAITHKNLASYVINITSMFPETERQRFSQAPDLNFDLSVHDLFVSWSTGSTLVVIPEDQRFSPAHTIKRSGISVWTSVPSIIRYMRRLRILKPGSFPSLRLSYFCGEPLFEKDLMAWHEAAPNSRIINLYGPTEATVALTVYEPNPDTQPAEFGPKIIPIGCPFPGHSAAVISDSGCEASADTPGELYLAGKQVAAGYYGRPEETHRKFTTLPDRPGVWYRTGDIVIRDTAGVLHYVGRSDFQVKINGFRIELHEVEHAVTAVTGCQSIVIARIDDRNSDKAKHLVAYFLDETLRHDPVHVLDELSNRLPPHMRPSQCIAVRAFPLTRNGKIDRHQLEQGL